MRVTLQNVSKAFGRETVVKSLDRTFEPGSRTAVLGPNGSGKSTLLQLAAGALMPSGGAVIHEHNGRRIDQDEVYRLVSMATPYMALYEELSLREAIATHMGFKPLRQRTTLTDLARVALLDRHMEKPVRNFSSGMKQRLKLTLAILSDTPLLLLDEPTTNLDATGIAWFRELLQQHVDGRTLLVASNRLEEETFACTASVSMG